MLDLLFGLRTDHIAAPSFSSALLTGLLIAIAFSVVALLFRMFFLPWSERFPRWSWGSIGMFLIKVLVLSLAAGVIVFIGAQVFINLATAQDVIVLFIINAVAIAALAGLKQYLATVFSMLHAGLFMLFYYLLIGIVLQSTPGSHYILSLVNGAVLAGLILRPRTLSLAAGHTAKWTARQLRRLPNALQ